MNIKKWIIIALIDLIIIAFFIVFLYLISHDYKINGIYMKKPISIRDFKLMDDKGVVLSKNNLKGHWTFIFFGFTNCKMICPKTMATLNNLYQVINTETPNKIPKIIFITIDPEHDTIEKLHQFVQSFNKKFIGAKSAIEQEYPLDQQFLVKVSKLGDTINHTSDIILLNPEVEIQAYFPYPHQYQKILNDYKKIIVMYQQQ